MSARRIDILSYGRCVDADLLRAKGLNPAAPRQAQVNGMARGIGKRAALPESQGTTSYGLVMALTHADIERPYAEPELEMHRPEAVRAELADGIVAPLRFTLVTPVPDEANPTQARPASPPYSRLLMQ